MERSCLNCKDPLSPLPKVKNHQYCSKPACQRSRKARWQRVKIGSDEEYRENQRKAQHEWQARNPDYWRRYRSANAPYRRRERQRQYRRRHPLAPQPHREPCFDQVGEPSLRGPNVVKMDASTPIRPGTYKMQAVSDSGGVAKMDAILVQLIVIQEDSGPQERTCNCQGDIEGRLTPIEPMGSRAANQHTGMSNGVSGGSPIDRNSLGGPAPCVPAPT